MNVICRTMMILMAAMAPLGALTVEEAYQAIPHHRTVFKTDEAKMPAAERQYLETLFNLVDQAIVARVRAARGEAVDAVYAPVFKAWDALQAPAKLAGTQATILQAIREQRDYLAAGQGGRARTSNEQALVGQSSGRLHAAYSQLMNLYPGEAANNRQAFFDYLCALDFV